MLDSKQLSNDEIRTISKEAYIYAFPILEFYRVEYLHSVLPKAFNTIIHERNLLTSNDKTVVAPNNATLYSIIHLDLRAEPYIIEVPSITNRYHSFQLIDVFTHVVDYIGTRATGIEAGKYLITGPYWNEKKVPGIKKIFRLESNFAIVIGRTGVNSPNDLVVAHAVQNKYKLYSLSNYANEKPPKAEDLLFPVVDKTYPANFNKTIWHIPGNPPLNPDLPGTPPFKEMSPDFITYLNFQLGRVKPVASEVHLYQKFAKIGIGPDIPFDSTTLEPSVLKAINAGITDAKAEINNVVKNRELKNGWTTNFRTYIFGNREQMEGRYLFRAYGALQGLLGNPPIEAVYPSSTLDSTGQEYEGTSNHYVLTFPAGQLPPTENLGFWSLTMYDTNGFLVENPINRYSIGSQSKEYVLNPDGSLSIYIQSSDPGKDKISNWLPAPKGPFYLMIRIFLPQSSIIEGSWLMPAVVNVN
ncbi:MAG: hypothetical protein RBG13Loki_0634 [Promethearchaeota archaeon CR_4]|nr:MAG: hypothetical protein RBG13Loki_0634 [Candidatus Lokiarchaeota archaeon CR_4]